MKPTIKTFFNVFDDIFESSNIFDDSIKRPQYDIIENDKGYVVELSLAGIKKEDINIDIEKNNLTIKAERKEINESKYNYKGTYYGMYEKSFTLPDEVDIDKISSSFVDGILKIDLPKLENKINIKKIIEIM